MSEKMLLTEFGSLWSATVPPRQWWSGPVVRHGRRTRARSGRCALPALQTAQRPAQVPGEVRAARKIEQHVEDPSPDGRGDADDPQVDVAAPRAVGLDQVGPSAARTEGIALQDVEGHPAGDRPVVAQPLPDPAAASLGDLRPRPAAVVHDEVPRIAVAPDLVPAGAEVGERRDEALRRGLAVC